MCVATLPSRMQSITPHPRLGVGCTPVCSAMSDSLHPHGLQPARFLCPWDFPGKNTGMGCHCLLQGIFPNPGIEPTSNTLAGRFFTTAPSGEPAHSDFLPKCTVWNGTGSFIVMWMNLESVTQSKASQKEKEKYHINTHTWNLGKWY